LSNWNGNEGDGHKHIIDLGNPIIDITLQDLGDKNILQNKKEILSRVIKIEQANIIRRNLGIKCFQEIKSNSKNESHCEWGMNFRSFEEAYIPGIYDSIRLALISLSINLQVHGRNEESITVKNLLKNIPKEDYYESLYTSTPDYFDWMKNLL
jgi:hypothetical protein